MVSFSFLRAQNIRKEKQEKKKAKTRSNKQQTAPLQIIWAKES